MSQMHLFKSPIVGDENKWEQLKLNPRQLKDWTDTTTAILYAYGAFGGILYSMMPVGNHEYAWFTDKIPIAATDDRILYLNPTRFFKYNLKQRIFVTCHEIWHSMLNHAGIFHKYRTLGKIAYPNGKVLPYVEEVMQAAGDCIINAGLVFCRVGEMPEGCYYKPQIVPYTMSLLEAYRVLYKHTNGGEGLPKNTNDSDEGEGKDEDGQGPFDQHLTPGKGRGKTPVEAIGERNQVQWDAAVTAARHTMKAMGTGSDGLDRMFGKITEPEYDWISVLRHCFNKSIGHGRQTWEHLDPEFVIRGIGAPGRLNYGAGFVAIADDSSGSIDQAMLDTFMGHVGVIVDDVKPKELLVAQCDDRIHEWEHVTDGSQLKRKVKGGGGTDFRPVFDRIEKEELKPDVLIYFTDMDGHFPSYAPTYPVIWASINPRRQTAPFGEVIYIPLEKRSWRDL
jgi:predicted metal-dependent peptidase